jgi:cysteine desulfurase/selenocysteine lyase
LVFTGHKCYGPSGIGVVYGKKNLLDDMPPFLGGGDMIETVAFDHITFTDAPRRFEAGTPPIAEAIGLAAAIDFMASIGMDNIAAHDTTLGAMLRSEMRNIPGVIIQGEAATAGIISFTTERAHPQDIATLLDKQHIAIRIGHHCCMPLMHKLNLPATARVSFGIYNTQEDIAKFTQALKKTLEMLS